MKTMMLILLVLPVLTAATCAAGRGETAPPGNGTDDDRAMSMRIHEPAFRKAEVVMMKSMPPKFEVVLEREMPTPGWQLVVDRVTVDAASGRIVAEVSEVGPDGLVAQVITPTPCRLSLGHVPRGSYVLELRLRRGTTGEYRPVHALTLVAD